jgi:Stress responsive A/B Barrel Domain
MFEFKEEVKAQEIMDVRFSSLGYPAMSLQIDAD